MGSEHDTDALEALARGQHVVDRAALDAHLATCDECARELAWLRAEQRIFRERDVDAPSTEALWRGVASKLPSAPTANLSPYRIAAPPPPVVARRPWRAFAAGFMAAALLGVGVAALTLKVNSTPARPRGLSHDVNQPRRERPDLHADASLSVSGPVQLRLETWSADVRVTGVEQNEIRATVRGDGARPRITRIADGRYELTFDGRRLSSGEVEVTLPRGSSVEVSTASGDVTLARELGDARIATTSGEVHVESARDAEVTSTSGDVWLAATGANVRVRTVSGDLRITQRAQAQSVDIESTSGDAAWTGSCGRGCTLGARSVSGSVDLGFAHESGFSLRFTTVSGEISDALATGVATPVGEGPATGRYGSAEGAVDVTTNSGSLALSVRR